MSHCKICQAKYARELHSRLHIVQSPKDCDAKAREMESEPIPVCEACHIELHKRMGRGLSTDEAIKAMVNSLIVGIFKKRPL